MKKFIDYINEGPNDPAIFKAIFLAGGPGSGKSFMVGQTALTSHGFKIVNSDDAFEVAMDKAGLAMDPETIFSAQGQAIRDRAKKLTGMRFDRWIEGRMGLVVDGTGKDAEKALGSVNITANKNTVPNDPQSPFVTSGIRLGTPAVTTRGFKNKEIVDISNWICDIVLDMENEDLKKEIKNKVAELCSRFPVYK